MNPTASPGPDGLCPFFYRNIWHLLKPQIFNIFTAFHNSSLDRERINRAHIVLLPNTVISPDAFRPISLQNCPVKAIAKLLTNRLKMFIPQLVHSNQTGFISGRNITENFVFAADFTNSGHPQKAPTMVIKLDFRKAFDLVSWSSLDKILHLRGFPTKFRAWI